MTEYLTADQMGTSKYLTPEQMSSEQKPAPVSAMGTIEDVARSAGSGALRGTAELADLPVATWNMGLMGVNAARKLAGYEPMQGDYSGNASYFRKGMENLTGGASEYQPKTTAGKYAGTVGEFVPGAIGVALTGGESLIPAIGKGIATSIVPGVASEAAGQATEGTKWEPYARMGAAVLGGKLSTAGEAALRPTAAIRATGDAFGDIRTNHINVLEKNGISLPAGLRTGNPEVQAIEGSTGKGANLYNSLNPQYTAKTMRDYLGADTGAVTPEAMVQAHNRIVNDLKEVNKVSLVPDIATVKNFDDALKDAVQLSGNVVAPIPDSVKDFKQALYDSMNNGQPLNIGPITKKRSDLQKIVAGSESLTYRAAAHAAVKAIDDMIDGHFKSIGTQAALSTLAQIKRARMAYQNYLAVEEAAPSAYRNNGILDSKEVAAALNRQNSRSFVQNVAKDANGNPIITAGGDYAVRNPFAEFTQAASNIFREAPRPQAAPSNINALNRIGNSALGMSLGNQLNAGSLLGIHGGMYVLGKAEKYGQDVLNRMAAGKMGQRVMNNLYTPQGITQLTGSRALTPGIMSTAFNQQNQAPAYKRGGRVSSHDTAANQLVLAAERAKKGWNAQTEPLLNQSDETVVKALEVANRSI